MNKEREKFVRNESDKNKGLIFPLSDAFKCAGDGIAYVFRTQRNIKIQVVVAILAIGLGFILSIPLSSWLAVIICIGLVFSMECLNTAIESIIDLISPEYHLLAKRAKDCAAAGVLIAAIISLFVGAIVYGSALLSVLSFS